jgi:hypothetical protein
MYSGGFSACRNKPVRQKPRDQSAITLTANAPAEAWNCEERSGAALRILVNRYALTDSAYAEISSVITAMIR